MNAKDIGQDIMVALGLGAAGAGAAGGCATGCASLGILAKIVKVGIATIATALAGEVVDHLPYLHETVPQGIEYFVNLFRSVELQEQLTGNLDKLGAGMGFLGSSFGGYFKSSQTNTTNYN